MNGKSSVKWAPDLHSYALPEADSLGMELGLLAVSGRSQLAAASERAVTVLIIHMNRS